nr:transposase [Gemmobacter sp.]
MYRRPQVFAAGVFFTLCLAHRGSDLLCRHVDALRQAVSDTRRERPFGIAAWVVLPDHLHCIWDLPAGDRDFSTRWGAIKARFTMEMRRAGFTPPPPTGFANGGVNPALRRKGEVGLWQPRFWDHHIRDEGDMANYLRYCWWNPVKHGLVARPQDWPFTSVHRDMRSGRIGPPWEAGRFDGTFGE